MSFEAGHRSDDSSQSLMDELLRGAVPEIKLALGHLIDRENSRPLPTRYARLLPDGLLHVTLRSDAAEALSPIAADLERELTDSCNRHGSLYDRGYRVRLQRTDDETAPLYDVEIQSRSSEDSSADDDAPGEAVDNPSGEASPPIPAVDPDATRIDAGSQAGWEPGRWLLVVEDEDGNDREVFRITDSVVTIGRATDDPATGATIPISDAPHVSRRQLALIWDQEDGTPRFRVTNLGLNPIHLHGADVEGAQVGKGRLDLDAVGSQHSAWMTPGDHLRIGEQGPVLRIDEIENAELEDEIRVDPDATVFE